MRPNIETVTHPAACQNCQQSHRKCEWESDALQCSRCLSTGKICGGPSLPAPRARPPCASCARARTRCEWVEDQARCLRCQSKSDHLCPLPPRKRLNDLPTVTETPPSLPRASTELVRRSVNQDLQQTLVAEGKARMQAVKLPLPAGWDVDQLSPALAQSILAISTIKFTAYSAEIDGLSSMSTSRAIDLSCTNYWKRQRPSFMSDKFKTIDEYARSVWSSLTVELGFLDNPNKVLDVSCALLMVHRLNLVPRPPEAQDQFRQVLGGMAVKCAQILDGDRLDDHLLKTLPLVTSWLRAREAEFSLRLGKPSSLLNTPPDDAGLSNQQLATFWTRDDPFVITQLPEDAQKVISMAEMWCQPYDAIATNYVEALAWSGGEQSPNMTISRLETAVDTLSSYRTDVSMLVENVLRQRNEFKESAVELDRIERVNIMTGQVARRILVSLLYNLKISTLFMIVSKRLAEQRGEDQVLERLKIRASGLQEIIAYACEKTFATTMRVSNVYEPLYAARELMEMHIEHFSSSLWMIPMDQRRWLFWGVDMTSFWDPDSETLLGNMKQHALFDDSDERRLRELGSWLFGGDKWA